MIDAKKIWAEVKDRNARWANCPRHHFPHQPNGYRVGERVQCQNCGVAASLVDIGNYIRGYMAAGGNATDIMPDWRSGRDQLVKESTR